MKAISLLQPWASLIVMGGKAYETRCWNTKFRGRILIHASARKDKMGMFLSYQHPFERWIEGLEGFYKLPFGSIIGEATVVDTVRTEDIGMKVMGTDEAYFGDYSPGRWAWELADPVMYVKPVAYKGALSIWNCDAYLPELKTAI